MMTAEIKIPIVLNQVQQIFERISISYYNQARGLLFVDPRYEYTRFTHPQYTGGLLLQSTYDDFRLFMLEYRSLIINQNLNTKERFIQVKGSARLNNILRDLKTAIQQHPLINPKKAILQLINSAMAAYPKLDALLVLDNPIDPLICQSCYNENQIDAINMIIQCPLCGYIVIAENQIQQDMYEMNDLIFVNKQSAFTPITHFYLWIRNITSTETEDELKKLPTHIYQLISTQLSQTRDDLRYITTSDIRKILKTNKLTAYNRYTPTIMKTVSGIGPPEIPADIISRSGVLFNQILDIQKRVLKKTNNRSYYPYYIYKLFEALLSKDHPECLRILYYVHLQAKETIEASDREWRRICHHLIDIPWKYTSITYGASLHQEYVKSLS